MCRDLLTVATATAPATFRRLLIAQVNLPSTYYPWVHEYCGSLALAPLCGHWNLVLGLI